MPSINRYYLLVSCICTFFVGVMSPVRSFAFESQEAVFQTKSYALNIDFAPGTKIIYENVHERVPERLEITIIERWENGMTWRYDYYDNGSLDAQGIDTVPSLDQCKALAPWTVPDDKIDDSCDFWLAPDQLRALLANKRTYYRIEREPDRAEIRLEDPKRTTFNVKIDEKIVSLNAIQATSTRQDTLIILNNDAYPLVLFSTRARLKLTQIVTNSKKND